MRGMLIVALITAALASSLQAAPRVYALQAEGSVVSFVTDFGADRITGTFPVLKADLVLDFENLKNSKIAVTLDTANASASFPFAAQALRGPKVLDAEAFPTITFQSTAVVRTSDGAKVDGILTIRGTPKPVTLDATLFRQQGQAEGDLSLLSVHLKGTIMRSEFGAAGWIDMVGDEVRLDIRARVAEQN